MSSDHGPLEILYEGEDDRQGAIRLVLRGRLTRDDVAFFRSEVERILEGGKNEIELDLSQLHYVDSIGLSEFVPIHQRIIARGGTVKITHPRRLIRHILQSANLDDLLSIGPALETEATTG